jgi:hypothetical protein
MAGPPPAEPASASHDALSLLTNRWRRWTGLGGQRGERTLTGNGRARSQILVTAPDSPVMALRSCRIRIRQDLRSSI